jgi:HTH-type transcriptional regulator / antitoxin HigA
MTAARRNRAVVQVACEPDRKEEFRGAFYELRKRKIMISRSVTPECNLLLMKVSPRVIRSEKETEAYTRALDELDQRGSKLTRAEKEWADLLTLLIEDFESKRYKLPGGKPVEVLRFLMDQRRLKQKGLVGVFRTRSIASEVLSGQRKLNREHIERLSQRFHVSPDVFFQTRSRRSRPGENCFYRSDAEDAEKFPDVACRATGVCVVR